MSMLLSRASEYGVQTMVELCQSANGEFVSVNELAHRRGLSPSFLSKVAKQLVEHGLVASQRGPGGGVRLARPASRIRVIEVVEAIEGPEFLTGCVMGLPECSEHAPCPLHAQWKPVRESILQMLAGRTLSAMAVELNATLAARRRLATRGPRRRTRKGGKQGSGR